MTLLPVFVGEHPPPGAPWAGPWEGQSGSRLARLAGLEGRGALFELAEGAHLVDRAGEPLQALRAAAEAMVRAVPGHPLVLCGERVALAFGADPLLDRLRWAEVEIGGRQARVAAMPFPSGRCLSYYDPQMAASTRAFLRDCLGLPVAQHFATLHPPPVRLTILDTSEQLLGYREAAHILGVTVNNLRVRVCRGVGPPVIRLGPKLVRFRERDLRAWLQMRTLVPAVSRRKDEAR